MGTSFDYNSHHSLGSKDSYPPTGRFLGNSFPDILMVNLFDCYTRKQSHHIAVRCSTFFLRLGVPCGRRGAPYLRWRRKASASPEQRWRQSVAPSSSMASSGPNGNGSRLFTARNAAFNASALVIFISNAIKTLLQVWGLDSAGSSARLDFAGNKSGGKRQREGGEKRRLPKPRLMSFRFFYTSNLKACKKGGRGSRKGRKRKDRKCVGGEAGSVAPLPAGSRKCLGI